jgi:hypothetical protein
VLVRRSKQYIKALHYKLQASWCRTGNKSVNNAPVKLYGIAVCGR